MQQEGKAVRTVAAYGNLNKATKLQQYPMPLIEEMVEEASKAKFLSIFDFVKGFWQVKNSLKAQALTAIITHKGVYEFLGKSMGTKNAPIYFQRLMETLCKDKEI